MQERMSLIGTRLKSKFGDQVHLDGESSEEAQDEVEYVEE
jgi:hypothetical protein